MNKENGLKIEIVEKNLHSLKMKLIFHENYPYFEGHFNDFKLLPALIQIHLVSNFAKEFLGQKSIAKEIPNLKFVRPICPEKWLELLITFNELQKKIDFTFMADEILYSSGSLKYE